jgi:hypothetical protein
MWNVYQMDCWYFNIWLLNNCSELEAMFLSAAWDVAVDLHNTHTKENMQGKNYTQLLEKYVVHIR